MQKTTQEYIEEFIEAIEKNNCTNFNEACMYISFSRATAYNHGLDKLDIIKEAIDAIKIKTKHRMKRNWINSENATLQLAAFRLLSDSEEHQKLNQSYIDHTTKGKEVNLPSWLNDKHEEDED